MKNWLFKNGYIFNDFYGDCVYTNYNAGITIRLNGQQKPTVLSLYGFDTKEYEMLSMAMAQHGLINL